MPLGTPHVHLESSITARDFYLRNGYHPNGAPTYRNQITGFPMIKHLEAQQPSHAPQGTEKTGEDAQQMTASLQKAASRDRAPEVPTEDGVRPTSG